MRRKGAQGGNAGRGTPGPTALRRASPAPSARRHAQRPPPPRLCEHAGARGPLRDGSSRADPTDQQPAAVQATESDGGTGSAQESGARSGRHSPVGRFRLLRCPAQSRGSRRSLASGFEWTTVPRTPSVSYNPRPRPAPPLPRLRGGGAKHGCLEPGQKFTLNLFCCRICTQEQLLVKGYPKSRLVS